MSNIDNMTANEQLFTELTSEEGAVVEGGSSIYVERIVALKAGADITGADDTYVSINGRKVLDEYGMATNRERAVHKTFYNNGSISVKLWDEDGRWSKDDLVGHMQMTQKGNYDYLHNGFTLSPRNGSQYKIYFKATVT